LENTLPPWEKCQLMSFGGKKYEKGKKKMQDKIEGERKKKKGYKEKIRSKRVK
jgi:hypothetical protein